MSARMVGYKWNLSIVLLLLCLSIHTSHTFFFSPLFRRQSSPTPTTNRDHVVSGGEASEQQSTFRFSSRPFQSPSVAYAVLGDQNLHVPKSLCIACGKFPWTPVALTGGSSIEPQQQQLLQSQTPEQGQQQSVGHDQPGGTLVLNALGDGQRRPFAIQFDSSQTQNVVSLLPGQTASEVPQQPQSGNPVSQQQQQQQRQSSILQPARPGAVWHPTSRPAQFYVTPTDHASTPEKQQSQFPTSTARPTPSEPSPVRENNNRPVHIQFLPPQLPQQQPPTVLQPVPNYGQPPTSIHQIAVPSQYAGVKPAVTPSVSPSVAPAQRYNGQEAETQFRLSNKPPSNIHALTVGTLIGAQQQQQQQAQQQSFTGFEIQGVQPAHLIHQEHTKVRGTSEGYRQSQSQYGSPKDVGSRPFTNEFKHEKPIPPFPPQQQQQNPQNIKVPILPRPLGTLTISKIRVGSTANRFQSQDQLPSQQGPPALPSKEKSLKQYEVPAQQLFMQPPPPPNQQYGQPQHLFSVFPRFPQQQNEQPIPAVAQLGPLQPPQQERPQVPLLQFGQPNAPKEPFGLRVPFTYKFSPPPPQMQYGPPAQQQNGSPPQPQMLPPPPPPLQNGSPPQQQSFSPTPQNGVQPQQIQQSSPPIQQQTGQIVQQYNNQGTQQQIGQSLQQQNGLFQQQQIGQSLQQQNGLFQQQQNGLLEQQQKDLLEQKQNGQPPQQQNGQSPQQQISQLPQQVNGQSLKQPTLQIGSLPQQYGGPLLSQQFGQRPPPQLFAQMLPPPPPQQFGPRPLQQQFGPRPDQFGVSPQQLFGPQQQFVVQSIPSSDPSQQVQTLSLHMVAPPPPQGFGFPPSVNFISSSLPQPQSQDFTEEQQQLTSIAQSGTITKPDVPEKIVATDEVKSANSEVINSNNGIIIEQGARVPQPDKDQGLSFPVWNVRTENHRKPQIVPIPVPNFIGSESQSEGVQSTSFNFYPSPQKVNFSPLVTPKDSDKKTQLKETIIKTPYLQSIGLSNEDESDEEQITSLKPEQPKLLGIQGGWEIIPATQYDITHLFNNQQQQPGDIQMQEVPDHIPVPVPFTIPAPPPSKSSVFVVSQQPRNQVPLAPLSAAPASASSPVAAPAPASASSPVAAPAPTSASSSVAAPAQPEQAQEQAQPSETSSEVQQTQHEVSQMSTFSTDTSEPLPPLESPQPLSVGIPIVQVQAAHLPPQKMQFNQLTPSIVTALHHAQRTSFLTHSHLIGQNQDGKQEVMYVDSVPVRDNGMTGVIDTSSQTDSGQVTGSMGGARETFYHEQGTKTGQEQLPVSCKHDHWMLPLPPGVKQQEHVDAASAKAPFLLYYPTPVQQSSVYWVEQPTPHFSPSIHQTISTLPPSPTSYGFKEPFSPEAVFSPPVFGWSPKIVQTSNALAPEPSDTQEENASQEVSEEKGIPEQQVDSTSTRPPFDIISVSKETIDADNVQSLDNVESTSTPTVVITTQKALPTKSSRFHPTLTVIAPAPTPESFFTRNQFRTTQPTAKAVVIEERKPSKLYGRPKSPKLVVDTPSQENVYTEVSGPTTTADCITDSTTDAPQLSTSTTTGSYTSTQTFTQTQTQTSTIPSSAITPKTRGPDKIRLRVGSRFPAGRPAISTSFAPTSLLTSSVSPSTVTAVPVYRPLPVQQEVTEKSTFGVTTVSTPTSRPSVSHLLTLEDIYKNSETRHLQESKEKLNTSTEAMPSFSVSMDTSSMSTSVSSSFGERERGTSRKLYRPDEASLAGSETMLQSVSATTTSVPISSVYSHVAQPEKILSQVESDSNAINLSTTTASPSMVTKVVKTVRVRQRMRPGGSQTGPIRSRITHGGRVRVVQRPVTPEYIKSFPEFATPEGEALGKEEQEEVKNALIDLKKIPDTINA